MQDYIMLEKEWEDSDCFGIQMTAHCSDIITAKTRATISDEMVDDLSQKLHEFICGNTREILWETDARGDETVACLSLKFMHKDKVGHILVEVYMELEDGGKYSEHNCCFYVETALGLLEKFCERLPLLKTPGLDIEIVLNEA